MSTLGPGLRWVVEQCRADFDEPAFVRFRCGAPVGHDELMKVVPEAVLAQLHDEGLTSVDDDGVRLGVNCNSINGIVSVMPGVQALDADHIHLNIDSMWLLQLVWRLAVPGGRVADLGTGNGLVAAYLLARFNQVVATDVHGPSLRYAQLTLDANRVRGRDSSIVCTDIASALRPGAFELVVANPPWAPGFPLDDQGRTMTFADGGPTGTELPSRFLRQAAQLLRPDGIAIVLALNPTYDDGRRPLHGTLDAIRSDEFDIEILASEVLAPERVLAGLSRRVDGLVAAEHVAVVIRRTQA